MSQKILVTGTSSGFGRLIALTLARKGHTVFTTMRDVAGRNKASADELRGIASREGLKLEVVEMEVTRDDSVDAAIGGVLKKAEHLDVVINNAGTFAVGHEEAMTPAQVAQVLDVNVIGQHRVNRAVLPSFRARGKGYVINVSSAVARLTFPFMGVYCASKAALESLTDAYRYELKPLGVEFTIVQPGAFPTGIETRMVSPKDTDRAQGYGPLANAPAIIGQNLERMMTGPNAPNPQAVADEILKLVESAAGTRPDRVVVDPATGEPVQGLNRAHGEVQKAVLTAMGMGQLL